MTTKTQQLLHEGFFRSASKFPDNVALCIGSATWTYQQLANFSALLAHRLEKIGVARGARVGLMLDRSAELYSALLAVLRIGSAYVPLEPSYPADRLNHIISSANLDAIVCLKDQNLDHLDGTQHTPLIYWNTVEEADAQTQTAATEAEAISSIDPKDPAYILFTSGSTGKPKGVVISHYNASAFVSWVIEHYQITSADRMSGHSDISFDLSVLDTFASWGAAATLFPLTDHFSRTLPGEFIRDHQLSLWFSVPSVLSGMAKVGQLSEGHLASLRLMMFCGEPLSISLTRQLMEAVPSLPVSNLYGPTEATVACSAYDMQEPPPSHWEALPIGWRTADTEVFVWTDEQKVAQEGESGEIFISGDQVSRGYWQNLEETNRKFGPDPRPGMQHRHCYKTGDIAVVTKQGPVFRGRTDFQIKFRGWRIELGDVENALNKLACTVEAAVVLQSQGTKLTGFVRANDPDVTADYLLKSLKSLLPAYMLPTHLRVVNDFPRTLNGKVDRIKLETL